VHGLLTYDYFSMIRAIGNDSGELADRRASIAGGRSVSQSERYR